MIPTVDLAPGAPKDWLATACAALTESGCVRLIGAYPEAQMAALQRACDTRYSSYFEQDFYHDARQQGNRRTLITLEVEGAFAHPSFYANDYIYPIASDMLGAGFVLGHLAVIVSRPGAADQFIHRDAPSLFGDDSCDAFLPSVGIAMVLPLTSIGSHNGGTRVWLGSHRTASDEEAFSRPSTVAELPLGSCLLFDVRLMHGGKANNGDRMRNIIYGAYHRKWFRDWDGFDQQVPISISRRQLGKVPARYRHLFSWRFDAYGGWRVRSAAYRMISYVPPALAPLTQRMLGAYRR